MVCTGQTSVVIERRPRNNVGIELHVMWIELHVVWIELHVASNVRTSVVRGAFETDDDE